jgi:aldose 1-epimerase
MKLVLLLALPLLAVAQDYRAERTSDHGIPVVRLFDVVNKVEVAVVPEVGNTGYEMKVNGKNILYFPFADVAAFKARPQLSGIPFLAPWGNRLDQQAFFANGKKYNFDMEYGNVRGQIPIHGLLTTSPHWEVVTVAADSRSARYTGRLRFWKHPDLMAQWPFAHEYEMSYILRGGELEVRTTVVNLSTEAMPIAIGFHPYFQIPGVPRDQYVAHIPARSRVAYDPRLLPTGDYTPMDMKDEFSLQGITLDNGFIDLVRGPDSRARFYIKADKAMVEVGFGPKYPAAVVWSPNQNGLPQPFLCFEPMTGVPNAVNLAGAGKYPMLQTVEAGGRWTESFWVKASGL